ncbi:MAG: DivIVA domain-containing protein [Ilumatobacteraceae bacterium]
MDLNPQQVRQAEFKTVKRGLDPDEVQRFLDQVADELENAQNQSTAMEARARAAVARLQELSDGAESQAAATTAEDSSVASAEQVDTISRTLLLAQRTADTTIAQAEAEGERLLAAATDEAATTLDSTREMSARLIDEARDEARKVGESERVAIASEVSSLKARRDFLESDVDHLEQFLIGQRERLREAATSMVELTERVPGGLGEVRRPLLSASDDDDEHDAEPAIEGSGDESPQWSANDEAESDADGADGEAVAAELAESADDLFAAEAADDVFGDESDDDVVAGDVPSGVGDDGPVGEADAGFGADAAADSDELVITPDISDFPPEDAAPAVDSDATPAGFGIADASGEIDRPDDDAGTTARFTFDDNA